MPDVEINLDNGKTLWSNLLQEVKEKSSKTCNLPISLLVLGNEGSGKSSLIARLQKSDAKHGVGLEFDYIEIKDESIDENKKLNIWISSGDTYHTNLLKYALNETNFGYSCCMIIVSLSEPWNLIDSLEEWLKNLKMHIDRLKIKPQDMQFFKNTLTRQFQEYSDPDLENEKQIVGKRRDTDFNYLHPSITEDPDKILVPLEDGVYEGNLGLPLMIVITKTDSIFTLEQNFDYNDDKFDFIQMHLRKIALKYGASLCYTSLKDDRNCDLLLNYLLHRCYGFPLMNGASVIDKDAIFIPAGWDNNKKINILSENLMEDIRKQMYSSLINKPLSLVRAHAQNRLTEPEVAEDEQVFLMKQQALIQRIKAMGSDGNIKDVSRTGSAMASSSASRGRKNVTGLASSTGSTSNTGSQQANEGVLANFFSSLLNKRGVSTTGSPLPNQQPSGSGDLSRCDSTISELDESQKDEILSNSSSSNINNADLIQSKLKETCEVIDPGKVTATYNINKFELTTNFGDETKGQLNSEGKLLLETSPEINLNLAEINVNNDFHKELKILDDTKDNEENKLDKDHYDIKDVNETIEDHIEFIQNTDDISNAGNLNNKSRDNITNLEETEIIAQSLSGNLAIAKEFEQECNKDGFGESEIQDQYITEFTNEKLSCNFDPTEEQNRDEITVECFENSINKDCTELETPTINTESEASNNIICNGEKEFAINKTVDNDFHIMNINEIITEKDKGNKENLESKINVEEIQNVELQEDVEEKLNENLENINIDCISAKEDDTINVNLETLTENVTDSEIVNQRETITDNENLNIEKIESELEEIKDEITDTKIENLNLQHLESEIDIEEVHNVGLQDIEDKLNENLENINIDYLSAKQDDNTNVNNVTENVIDSEIVSQVEEDIVDNVDLDIEKNGSELTDIELPITESKTENLNLQIDTEAENIVNDESSVENVLESDVVNHQGNGYTDNENLEREANITRHENIRDEMMNEKKENLELEINIEETGNRNGENEYSKESIEKIVEFTNEEPDNTIKKDEQDFRDATQEMISEQNNTLENTSSDLTISENRNDKENESKDSIIENESDTIESGNVDDQPLVTDTSKIIYEDCGQLT